MIQESVNREKVANQIEHYSFLCKATKTGILRFLSHREWITAVERTMRRASFPLWYTQGFHPKPKLTFSRALPTGLASEAIYFIVRLRTRPEAINEMVRGFNAKSPVGLKLRGMWEMARGEKFNTYLNSWSFRLIIKDEIKNSEALNSFLSERASDVRLLFLNKSFFMIEYNTVEENWLDYRDVLQFIYAERFPELFYMPILREVFYSGEVECPVSELFIRRGGNNAKKSSGN